jgi:hypothetical protein
VNLWGEWAKLEAAHIRQEPYQVPPDRRAYAGVLICLARQERPDLSGYGEPEIVFRLNKPYHAGLIVASHEQERVEGLIHHFAPRFAHDFLAIAPPLDKPPT